MTNCLPSNPYHVLVQLVAVILHLKDFAFYIIKTIPVHFQLVLHVHIKMSEIMKKGCTALNLMRAQALQTHKTMNIQFGHIRGVTNVT